MLHSNKQRIYRRYFIVESLIMTLGVLAFPTDTAKFLILIHMFTGFGVLSLTLFMEFNKFRDLLYRLSPKTFKTYSINYNILGGERLNNLILLNGKKDLTKLNIPQLLEQFNVARSIMMYMILSFGLTIVLPFLLLLKR